MIRKKLKEEWLQILILLVPFCGIALLWDKIPDWVPIHWNARGEVDGYARKTFGTLLLPLLNLGIAALLAAIPLIDPKLVKYDAEMRASLWRTLKIIRLGITGFQSVIALAVIAAAIGLFKKQGDFNYIIFCGIGLLYILLGNLMSKLRPNYFIGIRTPWTLESKDTWMKTHRAGGQLMVLGGILMIVLCPIVPIEKYIFWVMLPVSGIFAIFSMLYSYYLHRREKNKQLTA